MLSKHLHESLLPFIFFPHFTLLSAITFQKVVFLNKQILKEKSFVQSLSLLENETHTSDNYQMTLSSELFKLTISRK